MHTEKRRVSDVAKNSAHIQQSKRQKIKQERKGRRPKKQKPFDMSRFRQRQIVLKFAYFGENYFGLSAQENTEETIEKYLFEALQVRERSVDIRAAV